jgi:uncharacterized protein YjiS (DUF1127 family)
LIVYSPVVANSSLRREIMTTRGFAENCCERHSGVVAAMLARLRCRRLAARRRGLLHELDERMLRDIGLSRGDILLRTLADDPADGKRPAPESTVMAQRLLISRAAFALMIITLSIAVTVLAA